MYKSDHNSSLQTETIISCRPIYCFIAFVNTYPVTSRYLQISLSIHGLSYLLTLLLRLFIGICSPMPILSIVLFDTIVLFALVIFLHAILLIKTTNFQFTELTVLNIIYSIIYYIQN